jgi:hypothetical protein
VVFLGNVVLEMHNIKKILSRSCFLEEINNLEIVTIDRFEM